MTEIKASQFILFVGQSLCKLLMEFKQCQKSMSMTFQPKVLQCIEMISEIKQFYWRHKTYFYISL